MWILKNNKQTKQNRNRFINIEKKQVVARGEGKEEMGKTGEGDLEV